MNRYIILLIFSFLFFTHSSFSCQCKSYSGGIDSLRKISFTYSDVVFLGELIEFDTLTHSYTFEILELFKGNITKRYIKGRLFTSCSLFPDKLGIWIIYADLIEPDVIDINQCLASRSKKNPELIYCYIPPPPPGPNPSKEMQLKGEKYIREMKNQATRDWAEEIDLLRKK